ncbi:hypothetical protein CERZMDRAFT_102855 [Cercospora zeae-maydis SCOH1-5]|uniref:small monomeric GTPase n=1 Tax=Cercospora zeae-maydis SCOH1-5 TaxID=717836 RepID=A0A6A6EXQ8_9PEZI|nr:hypothetical protein CERZMDRAFT_102855 [Cercospora zeae-maydis SCOH1-5]
MALALDQASIVRQYLYSKQHIPTVRIAVLGCDGVGKRSLLQRFCYGSLLGPDRTSTREFEWHKHVAVQGRDVHVQFDLMSDGSLQQAQSNLMEYIQNTEGFMLVYDVTDQESFDVLRQICQLYSRIPQRRPWHAVPFFIVASKVDRWRGGWAVSHRMGEEFASSVGATLLSMSALNGEGTGDAVMVDVVSRVLLSRFQNDGDPEPRSFPRIQIHTSKELPPPPPPPNATVNLGAHRHFASLAPIG